MTITRSASVSAALVVVAPQGRHAMFKKLGIPFRLTVLVVLILAPALPGGQGEPVLKWHTYLGSSGDDQQPHMAVDRSGNAYLAGRSAATWGNPINPFSGDLDAFVAKLNSNGELEWNTFMGSPYYDQVEEIAMDGSGNVYVVGWSTAPWGIPSEPFPPGVYGAFVAKLNSEGELQWHRFLYGHKWGLAAAADANGFVYVGGWGSLVWETPPSELAGGSFVAKLDPNGVEKWHALLLGTGPFGLEALAVDVDGNVYAAGRSETTWGNPINPASGGQDGFVAKLNNTGGLEWNTFMGSSGTDFIEGIDLDGSGNVYVAGMSAATWGTPINPYGGGAFAAKLDNSGVRQWHTFIEGPYCWDIAVDGSQKVYVTGVWAGGGHTGFVAALNRDGVLQWKTGLEAILESIALDRSGNVYVAGQLDWTWGTPVNPHAGGWDAFVAKMQQKASINGDTDGDGKSDITVWRSSSGVWYARPSGSPGTYTSTQWGISIDVPIPGDYDADGKTDIAVWRPSSGSWFIIPSSAPATYIETKWGISSDIPVPGDYDGDGMTDIAVWRPSDGVWYILPSSASGTYTSSQWGTTGDAPIPADYDGDGRTDIAIWRPSTGSWFIVPSSAPPSYTETNWGVSPDLPAPGDYDGDGKIDIAVYRPSVGVWYVLPSTGNGSYQIIPWGASGDVPVAGDYDGDGKIDIAVWRPSMGQWFVLPSASPGTFTSTQWGVATDLPISPLTMILSSMAGITNPIVPGAWHGSTAGMSLDFTVNPNADGITQIKYTFSGLKCGGTTLVSGSITSIPGKPWPISNRQFLIPGPSNPKIALAGAFGNDGTTVTGTWNWSTCSGTWTGSLSTQ